MFPFKTIPHTNPCNRNLQMTPAQYSAFVRAVTISNYNCSCSGQA